VFRCPSCGNRLLVKARYNNRGLMCPRCHATLRVTAPSAAALLFSLVLLIGLLTFIVSSRMIFFLWIIFPFFGVTCSLLTKLKVVQESPSTIRQVPTTRVRTTTPDEIMNEDDRSERQRNVPNVARSGIAWRYCIYCGAPVSASDWRFCADCGASLPGQVCGPATLTREDTSHEETQTSNCMVCDLSLHPSDPVAHCPHCGNAAHKEHLLEWLHVKRQCPICGQHLTEQELL